MTFETFIERIREKSATVGLTEGDGMGDEEIKRLVNDVVQATAQQLIAAKDPDMVKEVIVTYGMTKPSDWHSTAGVYVIEEKGGKLYPEETMYVRYYYFPSDLVAADAVIPFKDYILPSMLAAAAILVMIRNHIDVTQHIQAASLLTQGIVGQVS